jgi:hypothetical protein
MISFLKAIGSLVVFALFNSMSVIPAKAEIQEKLEIKK